MNESKRPINGPPRRPLHPTIPSDLYQYRGAMLLFFAALVIWLNLSLIKPLVMGAIFAVVLYPLMRRSDSWRLSQGVRAGLITALFACVVILPFGLMVGIGANAALEKIQSLSVDQFGSVQFSPSGIIEALGLRPWVQWLASLSPVSEDQIRVLAARAVTTAGTWMAKVLQGFVTDLPRLMFSNLVIVLSLFFLLLDGPRFVGFIRENSFLKKFDTDRVLGAVGSLCYSVLVASVASGLVQATLVGVACVVTGTEGVALIVLVTFIASFLPVIGTAPITLFLLAQAIFAGKIFEAVVFLIFLGIVGVSDNVVRPFVLKGGAQLHPLVGFVAAFGGLNAIGFYGLFIGPVVAGVFFTLLPMVVKSYTHRSGPGERANS